jgi:hypothetical protein
MTQQRRFTKESEEEAVRLPGAERMVQSTDVFAAADGTLYVTDTNAGLNILAYDG